MTSNIRVQSRKTHEWGFKIFFGVQRFYEWCGPIWALCEKFRLIRALKVVLGFLANFLVMVNELRSQIFFVIRVEGHSGRLHAKFESFISIVRTKCSQKTNLVLQSVEVPPPPTILNKNRDFFLKLLPPKLSYNQTKLPF